MGERHDWTRSLIFGFSFATVSLTSFHIAAFYDYKYVFIWLFISSALGIVAGALLIWWYNITMRRIAAVNVLKYTFGKNRAFCNISHLALETARRMAEKIEESIHQEHKIYQDGFNYPLNDQSSNSKYIDVTRSRGRVDALKHSIQLYVNMLREYLEFIQDLDGETREPFDDFLNSINVSIKDPSVYLEVLRITRSKTPV